MNSFTEKYGLITHGINRTYNVPINKRVYGYERANLELLKVEEFEIHKEPWNKVLVQLVTFLQKKHNKTKNELLDFKITWAKGVIFDTKKFQINCAEIEPGLWFNNSYASNHAIMLIQDLISFYKLKESDCKFVVHLPCMSEPLEVIKYFKGETIRNFQLYLLDENLSETAVQNVIRGIEMLNKVLVKLNLGSNDFFLVDNRAALSNMKSKCLFYCKDKGLLKDKKLKLAEKFLNYYSKFFYEYEMQLKVSERKSDF